MNNRKRARWYVSLLTPRGMQGVCDAGQLYVDELDLLLMNHMPQVFAGPCVRFVALLSDARTSAKLWTERLHRELDDVFALQDEHTAIFAAPSREAIWQVQAQAVTAKPESACTATEWCTRATALAHRWDRASMRLAHSVAVDARILPSD